jgi:23S rRNA pseudouridine2605 synthase
MKDAPVRLQKFLADAGVASRRASEQIILAGRVTVNGTEVRELGTKVHPGRDEVAVDGRRLKQRRRIYVALNKPVGYLCTRHDPLKRRAIGDLLPKEWDSLYSVGRLDRDSEGLIFLTNDGDFACG